MNDLGNSLKDASNESLLELKEKNAGCESVVTLVDSIIASREREGLAELARIEFESLVSDMVNLPEPPQGIMNLFLTWAEVEVPDGEPEDIEVPDGKGKGKTVTESRQATVKVWQWVIKTNHACQVGRVTSGTKSTPKRAIKVLKRNGLALVEIGNFPNAKDACDYLKLTVGSDSATRVLDREGYIHEAFDGEL